MLAFLTQSAEELEKVLDVYGEGLGTGNSVDS
jgi:hypothetical protein